MEPKFVPILGSLLGTRRSAIGHLRKPEGNWAELTFAKASGTVAGNREKNWPIADRRVLGNDPRSLCERSLGPVSFSFLKWRMWLMF